MREHEHALAFGNCVVDDRGGDDGFAGAGRRDRDDAALAGRDFALDVGNDVALIWPELRHDGLRTVAKAAAIVACTMSAPVGAPAMLELSSPEASMAFGKSAQIAAS